MKENEKREKCLRPPLKLNEIGKFLVQSCTKRSGAALAKLLFSRFLNLWLVLRSRYYYVTIIAVVAVDIFSSVLCLTIIFSFQTLSEYGILCLPTRNVSSFSFMSAVLCICEFDKITVN